MAIKHIIYIPVTGVGLSAGFRGNSWYSHRIEVFKRFTLKSLKNQINQDFTLWLSFRREEENNPLTQEIVRALAGVKFEVVMTFDGLMYIDDKFLNPSPKTLLRNLLMMLMACWRNRQIPNPVNLIRHTFEDKNKTLVKRLDKSLSKLEDYMRTDADWVYLTRIDSDDLFHMNAVGLIQDQKPALKKALVFKTGYVYNVSTGQVADWNPTTNPPFHTIIFPSQTFFNPAAHKEYYGSFKSHESITTEFNCTTLPDHKYVQVVNHGNKGNISTYWGTHPYMVTTGHNTNIGTHWNLSLLGKLWHWKKNKTVSTIHPYIGQEYFGKEKENILAQFGVYL